MIHAMNGELIRCRPLETPNGVFIEMQILTSHKIHITLPSSEAIKLAETLLALTKSQELKS